MDSLYPKRRPLFLLAVLALILPLLAACGGNGGGSGDGSQSGNSTPSGNTTTTAGTAATGQPTSGAGQGAVGGPAEGEGGPVTAFSGWGGEEKTAFEAVLKWCDQNYKTQAKYQQASGDFLSELSTRVQGGNPPDVAFVSTPSTVAQYAQGGSLKALDFLDQGELQQNYAPFWLQAGTVDDKLYALYMKADNKSLVWYSPKKFKQGGYQIPKTYDELVQLSERMVKDGRTPWAFGVQDGWTLTDFFENVYLRTAGAENYDKLVNHEIPWTDPSVKKAFEEMNRIIAQDNFIAGGRSAALGQRWSDAAVQALSPKGKAQMFQEASFVGAAMRQELPQAKAGTDYDAFAFPPIGGAQQGATPVVVGPNAAVMLNDTPGARALIRCLADPRSATPWAKRGGYISPNKNVPLSVYPSETMRMMAKMVTEAADAGVLRMDGSDLMPPQFGSDYLFRGLQNWFKNPKNIDGFLQDAETQAARAYRRR